MSPGEFVRPSRVAAAILCAFTWTATPAAHAQSRGTGRTTQQQQPQQQQPDTQHTTDVDTFVLGVRAYEAQDYNRALTIFQEVYVRTQRPEVLFNIGMTQQQLQHRTEAARAFRQYLTRLPNAPNRADVESRVHRIDDEIRADEEAQRAIAARRSAQQATVRTREEVRVHRPLPALIVAGVGAVSLVASLTFALLRLDAIGDCMPNGTTLECPSEPSAMRAQRAGPYTIATDVTFGVGLAAVAGGALWYFLGARTERVQVTVDASPSGAGLRMGVTF